MRKIYCVYDKKAQELLGGLVMFRNDAPAVRYFTDGVSTEGSIVHQHPEDFELLCVAEISSDGRCTAYPDPVVVVTGAAVRDMLANSEQESAA